MAYESGYDDGTRHDPGRIKDVRRGQVATILRPRPLPKSEVDRHQLPTFQDGSRPSRTCNIDFKSSS